MINIINKEESREVSIRQCANGYIVSVGCTTVVFNTLEEMLSEITEYFNSPGGYEKKLQEQRYSNELKEVNTVAYCNQ